MAKFKLDENLPVDAAAVLSNAGHDALTIRDQDMGGEPDETVIDVCMREQRALITLDLDFADIRSYPPESYFGLIVLRMRRQSKSHILQVLERLLETLEQEVLTQRLWIVDESGVRIRESS